MLPKGFLNHYTLVLLKLTIDVPFYLSLIVKHWNWMWLLNKITEPVRCDKIPLIWHEFHIKIFIATFHVGIKSQIKSFTFIITQFCTNLAAREHRELSRLTFYLYQYNEYNCNHSTWWANCIKSWMITSDGGPCVAYNDESRYWSNIWFIIMEMGFTVKFRGFYK